MFALFPSREVAIELFGFQVHWYGLLYLAAFAVAGYVLPRLQRYRGLAFSRDDWFSLLSWGVVGVIVGGRLGYVLFYDPVHFLQHPLDIPAVWKGGMAFHGGMIGVVIALAIVRWKKNLPGSAIADTVVVPVAIGLALGRFGNFINQELYGTVTTLPWGIAVPGEDGLRHPTQLYAMGKDLLIAAVCYWHLTKDHRLPYGRTCGLFFLLYGVGRFLLEYLREQDYPWTEILGMSFTRAQLLCIPMIIAGIAILAWFRPRSAA